MPRPSDPALRKAAGIVDNCGEWHPEPTLRQMLIGRIARALDHEDPTPAMLARGVAMHRTPRSGDDETLVHDIWQAMWDEMMTEESDG